MNPCLTLEKAIIERVWRGAHRVEVILETEVFRRDVEFEVVAPSLGLEENLKHIAQRPCLQVGGIRKIKNIDVGDFRKDEQSGIVVADLHLGREMILLGRW